MFVLKEVPRTSNIFDRRTKINLAPSCYLLVVSKEKAENNFDSPLLKLIVHILSFKPKVNMVCNQCN